MKGFSAFLDMGRCKDWAHKINSWKYLSRDLFHQFSWSTKGRVLHPELPSGRVKGQQLHRIQSLQRQMADAIGEFQLVVDTGLA